MQQTELFASHPTMKNDNFVSTKLSTTNRFGKSLERAMKFSGFQGLQIEGEKGGGQTKEQAEVELTKN